MAILLDQQARATLAHRRARGRDATLMLHLVPLRGWQHMLRVDSLPRFWRPPGLVPSRLVTWSSTWIGTWPAMRAGAM
jgi:hypothetical protein